MSRTPKDYAIEHAEYMAISAERLLRAVNERDELLLRREESDDVGDDEVYDVCATVGERAGVLRKDIYEFRKRRDRAAAAPLSGELPDDLRAQALDALKGAERCLRAAGFTMEGTITTRVVAAIAALSAAQPAQPVMAPCYHEAYQGACVHCGVPFVNGRPAAPAQPAQDARDE